MQGRRGNEGPSATRTADTGQVRGVVATLERVLRSWRLYDGGGPTLERQLDDLANRIAELTARSPVRLRISSHGPLLEGRPLLGGRDIDPSWFVLFQSGAREISFLEGATRAELGVLVEILCSEPDYGDDPATALWRSEVHGIELGVVSMLDARVEQDEHGHIVLVEQGNGVRRTASAAFAKDDLRNFRDNTDLSWLELGATLPREQEPLTWEPSLEAEAASQDYGRFLDAFQRAEEQELGAQRRPWEGAELPPLLEEHLLGVIQRREAGRCVQLLQHVLAGIGPAPARLRRVLAQEDWLTRLAPLCDEAPEEMASPIRQLTEQAGTSMTPLLIALRSEEARLHYAVAAGEAGGNVLPFYLQQLDAGEEHESLAALESISSMDAISLQEGFSAALSSRHDRVRYKALRELDEPMTEGLLEQVLARLSDHRRVNRIQALRKVADSADRRVPRALLKGAESATFSTFDPEEQRLWLTSLARFDLPPIWNHFRARLEERSMMRAETAEQQLRLVEVLATVRGKQARGLLEEARGDWQLARVVRRAISAALRGEVV